VTRPTSYRLRRSFAAGTAALALVALAGCGGDSGSTSNASDTSSASASPSATSPSETATSSSEPASEAASEAPSEPAGVSPEAGAELSADQFASLFETALDQATTANVQVETGSTVQMKGQIDFTTEPASVRMGGEIAGAGALDMILVDKVAYLSGKVFGTGDKWIKLDLDDSNSPLGALGDQLDPASSLEKLVDGIKSATYVGPEDVDGDSLDHYTAAIDTKALLKGLPAGTADAAGLPATVDYQVWFDSDGLIRKFSVDLGAGGTSGGTFSDWGTKVDIAAPPASQVTSMPGM